MRTRLSGLVLTGSLLIGNVTAHAVPKYATYHINYVYLTPIAAHTLKTIDQFLTPDKGKTFLVVSFRVANKDDVQQEIQYDDLKVTVPTGEVVEQSFENQDPALSDKVLVSGGTLAGNVTWEIPASAHHVLLTWAPSPGFSDAVWPAYHWTVTF